MNIHQQLYDSAKALIEQRYPTGWGGAAALYTEKGLVLTSVAPDRKNDALSLCMEVGACLEAHKFNQTVTHSLCMYRENETSPFVILSPCGICQERLLHWGESVQVAISNEHNELIFIDLGSLMPHHWSMVNK